MAATTILYDSLLGSDSNGGGNGPILTGVNGDISVSTLTLNEVRDFTGTVSGNPLYFQGLPGDRHLFTIAAFIGGIATCTGLSLNEVATQTVSGSQWGVGGKRATLQTDTGNPDISDGQSGWTFSLEGGAANQAYPITVSNVMGAVGDATNGPLSVMGTGATRPVITFTGDFAALDVPANGHILVNGVDFTGTVSVSSAHRAVISRGNSKVMHSKMVCQNSCIQPLGGVLIVDRCDFRATSAFSACIDAQSGNVVVLNSFFHDSNHDGILVWTPQSFYASSNRFVRCGRNGIRLSGHGPNNMVTVSNNVIDSNTSDGLFLGNVAFNLTSRNIVVNNIFTRNGGYGINANAAGSPELAGMTIFNAYGSGTFGNTLGDINTAFLVAGEGDVILTVDIDPYINSAGDVFTLDTTNGALAIDAGYGYNG